MRIPAGEHFVDCPTCEGRGYLSRDERSTVLAELARLTEDQVALERLRGAIAFLRVHVQQNAGGVGQLFSYVWQSVWEEFERRLES